MYLLLCLLIVNSQVLCLNLKAQIGPNPGPPQFLNPPVASTITASVVEADTIQSSVLHPMISNQIAMGTRVRLKNPQTGYSVICTNIAYGPLEAGMGCKLGEGTWRYLGINKDRKTFKLEISSFNQDDVPL